MCYRALAMRLGDAIVYAKRIESKTNKIERAMSNGNGNEDAR